MQLRVGGERRRVETSSASPPPRRQNFRTLLWGSWQLYYGAEEVTGRAVLVPDGVPPRTNSWRWPPPLAADLPPPTCRWCAFEPACLQLITSIVAFACVAGYTSGFNWASSKIDFMIFTGGFERSVRKVAPRLLPPA